MYTFGRTTLRLSEEEFWDMSPRILFRMIKEQQNIELTRAKLAAHLNRGGTLENDEQEAEERIVAVTVHPDAF